MKKYCDLIPKIHDKQGNEVESKLFSDLLSFYNDDRKATKKAYFAAIHPVFLDSIANNEDVTFDENGEITLHSLIKVANLDPQNDILIQKLNKDIKSGVYSYVEGLQKAREFNRSEYGDRFLATLIPDKKGNYKLEVVHNTTQNRTKFEKVLVEQETLTMVIDELNNQGVKVDFTDTKEYDGRYSTIDASKAADGMYHLITISRGAKNVNQAFIEEAAHFAIAALRETSPVKRLITLCSNSEIAERLKLYSEDEVKMGINENTYETAGRVLALAFGNKNLHGFGGFLNRVKSFIYSIFSKIAPNSFIAKRQQIIELAEQIVDEFSYGRADLQTALEDPVVLFSGSNTTISTNTLLQLRATVKKLANQLYVADTKLYNLLKDSEAYSQLSIEDVSKTALSRAAQLSQLMISTVLEQLDGHLHRLSEIKAQKDAMLPEEYKKEYREQVYLITQYTNSLIAMRNSLIALEREVPSLKDYLITCTANGNSGIDSIIGICSQLVTEQVQSNAAEIYTTIVGTDRIIMDGKVVKTIALKKSKDGKTGKEVTVRRLTTSKESEISAEDLVTRVFNGGGPMPFLARLFQAPHKLNDTALSYLKMYIRDTDTRIQRHISSEFEPEMNELERLIDEAGFTDKHDLIECLEEDSDGNYYNFRSEYKPSVYEEKRAELIKEIVSECKEYINNNPSEFPTKGSRTRFINKTIREDGRLQSFEEQSWVVEDDGTKHLNPDFEGGIYIDSDYIKMLEIARDNPSSKEAKKIKAIEALRNYKILVDALLNKPGGDLYGIPYRIPQISTKNRLIGPISKRSKRALVDSGADFEIGVEGSGIYQDALEQVEGVFQKLPLYGIKKINNPSTDLLTSLKLYTIMAVRYNELNSSLIDLQIVKEALQRRTPDESSKGLKSQSDIDVESAINKLLFGEANPYANDSKLKWWGRVTNGYFIVGTLLGNVLSFVRNFIASNYTMTANSTVSKYYNIGNYLTAALSKIFIGIPARGIRKVANLFGAHLRNKDKLILHHINGTYNKTIAWDAYKPKAWLKYIFYQAPMALYSKGDEFAQECAYLATLKHFKGFEFSDVSELLSDAHDSSLEAMQAHANRRLKKYNLRKIYKFSSKDDYGNTHEGVYLSNSFLKRREDAAYYAVLKEFHSKLKDVIDENKRLEESGDPFAVYTELSDMFYTKNTFTRNVQRVLEYLDIEYQDPIIGMYTVTLSELADKVQNAINNLLWTENDLMNLSNGLISELVEVQGTYFTGLRAAIQTEAQMQGAAIFFGYGIGAANKFFNSNFNVLTGKFEPSMLDAILFSWNRQFRGVIESEGAEGLELRRKSLLEFMTIAALNVPGLELLTRNRMAKEVLMKAGYDEYMIRRMHTLGNGLLWWFLYRFIAHLFKNRNPEKIGENLSQSIYKSNTYKGYDLEKFDLNTFNYSNARRLMMGLDAQKSLVFDMLCPPPLDSEIVSKQGEKNLQSMFGKKNGLTLAIINDPQFQQDALNTLKKYSDFLHDYASLVEENPGVDYKQLMENVAAEYGISKSALNSILTVDIPYSKKYHKHGIYIKKKSGRSQMPYNQFLESYNMTDTDSNRKFYEELKASNSDYVAERYYLSNPEHAKILAEHTLANAYKSINYDKDSDEYKIAGIIYYLLACSADEVGSMMTLHQNVKDIAANVKFISSSALKLITDVGDILNNAVDDREYRDEALWSMVKKSGYDMILSLVGFETDNYGNILPPENPEELSSGELEYNTGAKMQDYFVKYSTKKNFESMQSR